MTRMKWERIERDRWKEREWELPARGDSGSRATARFASPCWNSTRCRGIKKGDSIVIRNGHPYHSDTLCYRRNEGPE